jgi:putative mRNA 3-end processing factor
MKNDLLEMTDSGLYCRAGDFHIDPSRPVDRAVLTHAHADHAHRGSRRYLVAAPGLTVFRTRLGSRAELTALEYGRPLSENGVTISFHPAGHILGSAQVRLEHQGQVWVVSGDYKLEADVTCVPFEPVRCHVFVTESTFGLPAFHWPNPTDIFLEINAWWRANREAGRASLLFGYALGKSQRLLSGLDFDIGPIYLHKSVARLVLDYRRAGVLLPPCRSVGDAADSTRWAGSLILAPPTALESDWAARFGPASIGLASGWMLLPDRRPEEVDKGFVLSDHADCPGLLQAVRATAAERVLVTHGYVEEFADELRARGVAAEELPTPFQGEAEDEPS